MKLWIWITAVLAGTPAFALPLDGAYEQVGNCQCQARPDQVCKEMFNAATVIAGSAMSDVRDSGWYHTADVVKNASGHSVNVPMVVFQLKEWGKEFKVRQTDRVIFRFSSGNQGNSGYHVMVENQTLPQQLFAINLVIPSRSQIGSSVYQSRVTPTQVDLREDRSRMDETGGTAGPSNGGHGGITAYSTSMVRILKQPNGLVQFSTYWQTTGNGNMRAFSCTLKPVL
jgi:hypothetical protein